MITRHDNVPKMYGTGDHYISQGDHVIIVEKNCLEMVFSIVCGNFMYDSYSLDLSKNDKLLIQCKDDENDLVTLGNIDDFIEAIEECIDDDDDDNDNQNTLIVYVSIQVQKKEKQQQQQDDKINNTESKWYVCIFCVI